MYGKYADRRVYHHFFQTYSRVPYLDHEIFNVSERSKRLQRQAGQRASSAMQGLERITAIADKLEKSLKDSRNTREKLLSEFKESPSKAEMTKKPIEICLTPPTSIQAGESSIKDYTPNSKFLGTATTNSSSLRRSYRRHG